MKIHLISIGGAVMHNFALALQSQGHQVTGSDDAIFEPSKSRLSEANLLPAKMGWDKSNISSDLNLVILGMHAKKENPELKRALELGIPTLSFPEYTFNQSENKTKLVVAGSHGKTTTTGMLMHVFKTLNKDFDFLVGSKLDGYERMVQFTDAPAIIIEGDEYLSSALDMNPKFLHYKPELSMITGIAWDHINVFSTFENYVLQFERYLESLPKGAICFYNQTDENLSKLCALYLSKRNDIQLKPYGLLEYKNLKNGIEISHQNETYNMPWFGRHNVSNATGAMLMAEEYGIPNDSFLRAMQSFGGTARRLEEVFNNGKLIIIRDFAHSPSKVKATTSAVKEQYSNKNVIAVLELHTYSSLQKEFLPQYENSLATADIAIVYTDDHVFELKKMPKLSEDEIKDGFHSDIKVLNNREDLLNTLTSLNKENTVLLMMSSGSFSGIDLTQFFNG